MPKKRSIKLVLPTIVIILAISGIVIYTMQKPSTAVSAAPNFTLTSVDGKAFSLSDFSGRIVLLQIFATW